MSIQEIQGLDADTYRARRGQNMSLDTSTVLQQLSESVRNHATVVGRWVWVKFATRPDKAIRAELTFLGFHWNSQRAVWQHACGRFTRHAPYDPRDKYTEKSAEDFLVKVQQPEPLPLAQ